MTLSAFLILEINLWLPRDTNLISMAKTTLGMPGQCVAWISYLLLLYALLAAYITGGGDFLHHLLTLAGISIPLSWSAILFTLILGFVVYTGIQIVDYVNRGLMIAKIGSYFLLVLLILPHISFKKLTGGQIYTIGSSVTVCLVSFGFATIVPSLRIYFEDDKVKLRKAILIGSSIPLFYYILWNLAIMGVIPRGGNNGLMSMLHSGRSTSEFVEQLNILLQQNTLTNIARFFTSICLATAFLGVSLGLTDFLADGFSLEKKGWNAFFIALIAFLPPLLIALYYPRAFVAALGYAGIDCVILVIFLPALMAWHGVIAKIFHSRKGCK